MSKRKQRGRDPERSAGGGAPETGGGRSGGGRQTSGRPGEARSAGGGRSAPGRQASGASLHGPGEARRPRGRTAPSWNLGLQLAFLVAVFAVVTLLAELAGAANLGVALGVGQIAFAIAVIYLLLRR